MNVKLNNVKLLFCILSERVLILIKAELFNSREYFSLNGQLVSIVSCSTWLSHRPLNLNTGVAYLRRG